ncbi:unnamed protein product [Lota lota]
MRHNWIPAVKRKNKEVVETLESFRKRKDQINGAVIAIFTEDTVLGNPTDAKPGLWPGLTVQPDTAGGDNKVWDLQRDYSDW